MDGFKKDGKFIPTDNKRKTVSTTTIQKGQKQQEMKVSNNNFRNNSNSILEQKMAHLNK